MCSGMSCGRLRIPERIKDGMMVGVDTPETTIGVGGLLRRR